MRHLFFAFLTAFSISAYAQDSTATPQKEDPIAAPAAAVTMSADPQGIVTAEIPEVHAKDVQKDWPKYANKGSKIKPIVTNGQYIQAGAVNKNISQKPFNLSAAMLESSAGVRLTVQIMADTTEKMSPAQVADRSTALQKYVRDFAITEYRDLVQDQLKAAQNKQKVMERYQARLIRENEKSTKHISENQRSIQKATDDIAAGKADITATEAQIETQKGMVQSTAGDANASKGANKTMDDLLKHKKEVQRKNESRAKDIDNWNKDIRDEQRSIAANDEKQAIQTLALDKQKLAVSSIQVKLESIK